MDEAMMINIQIDDSGRVVCWDLQSNAIGADDASIKEITVPLGVDESNFIDYILQEDGSLLNSPIPIVSIDDEPPNKESLAYLAETDWYVVRKYETGTAIPQEILIKRQEAREAIISEG